MQLFRFFHTENTSKQQLLSENDFEAVLVNFCCYDMNMVPMLLRQLRRLVQGHCWSYTNSTANFKATPMKKHI